MRGRALLPLLLLAGIACQDSLVPAGEPNIRVVDGANPSMDTQVDPYASSFFFFKSPIVPEPSAFNGAFSPTVQTTVEIWSLGEYAGEAFVKLSRDDVYAAWNGGAGYDPSGYGCYGQLRGTYSGADISVDDYTETYALGWNTDDDLGEGDLGYVFRVCVSVADPFGGEDILLGYRDVSPDASGADIPRDGAELPIYQFNLGRNLPVKYWIGGGALCRDADGRIIDCTTVTFDANGGTSTCNDAQCGIYVPEGAIQAGETATFQVRYVSCDAYNADNTVEYLDIDIPQYFGCLEVSTVATYDWLGYDGLGPGITVASCRDTGILGPQDERLLLHIESDADNDSDGRKDVYALPTRPFELECDGSTPALGAQASLGEKAKYYFAQGARALQRTLVPWVSPPELTAAHAGFGGGTSLSCDGERAAGADGPLAVRGCSTPSLLSGGAPTLTEVGAGEAVTYRAVWALPSEITEKLQVVSDGSGGETTIPWDGVVYGSLDDDLYPAVRVQDECKPDADPYVMPDGTLHYETCSDPGDVARDVEGAFVTFKFFDANDQPTGQVQRIRTGSDGIAKATWNLPSLGSFEAYVGGLGVGVDQALMDYSFVPAVTGTGSYQDHVGNTAVQLATGLVRFQAAACSDKSSVLETPGIDPEYDTSTIIPINISGSDGDNATLFVTSDCYNVYFALEVPESEDLQNSLRIVFVDDDNADFDATGEFSAVPEVGDDMWFISRNDDKKDTIPDGSWMIQDWHVSDDCTGSSKQSECGKADVLAGGTDDLDGGPAGTVNQVGTSTVYEFARSFENTDALDFAVPNIGETGYIGFYLVLQMGKGAQGNTEYPDFRVFQPIEIVRQ